MKKTEYLENFLNGSDKFIGFTFSGCYDMKRSHFIFLFNHFIKTKENLLDDYSKITYIMWDNQGYQEEAIETDQFEYLIGLINNKILRKLFSEKYLQKCEDKLNFQHSIYLNSLGYDFKRIQACLYTTRYDVRQKVFKIHGRACLRCGAIEKISLDHIVAVKNGGENSIDNLQPLCKPCNSSKGSKTIDYRKNVL